jgi:osmotically-inducible protein OsmY
MSFLSRWFGGSKYDDTQLVAHATRAVASDPLIRDPESLLIASTKGVITLSGIVPKSQEKDRIEGVVRSALTTAGLKHERIINELKLPHRGNNAA